MATITYPGGTVQTPLLALADTYKATRGANNVVHDLLGGGVAFSLQQGKSRTGTIRLLYATKASAMTAIDQLSLPVIFTFTETTPAETITFAVAGPVGYELDTDGQTRYIVTVPYRAVSA